LRFSGLRPDWAGEQCFIIAGGPSVKTQPVELLQGRKVIAINSSYTVAPRASVLFFNDYGWWLDHRRNVAKFAGQVITTCPGINNAKVLRLRNSRPGRKSPKPVTLSEDPRAVPVRRTCLTGALNIAFLKGCKSIVVLGADGKAGPNGERNHHAPHTRKCRPAPWDRHYADLAPMAAELRARGVEVLNASPGSAWDLWPVVTLQEAI
jgi:hypothetical protein